MKVRYEDIKFVKGQFRYDGIYWQGLCLYQGKLYHYVVKDETDYDTMNDTCPCCKEGGHDNWSECHCESYVDLICTLVPASLLERLVYFLRRKK